MNNVVYLSYTEQSKKIATYVGALLNYDAVPLEDVQDFTFQNLVLVFPVHCQNLPSAVKTVLPKIVAKNVVLIATYGKMSYGNALRELQTKLNAKVVCGIYLPTKHAYLKDDDEFKDFEKLNVLVERLREGKEVIIPRSYKNPFASFFPKTRSKLGVRLIKNGRCNGCNLCKTRCNVYPCIRCLKCVNICPQKALDYKLTTFMGLYLKKKKKNDLIIY